MENDKDKMSDIKNDEQVNKLVKKVIRTGLLKLGGEFYTLDVIKEMVIHAEKYNLKERIYPIFIEIYKELKRRENNDYE